MKEADVWPGRGGSFRLRQLVRTAMVHRNNAYVTFYFRAQLKANCH